MNKGLSKRTGAKFRELSQNFPWLDDGLCIGRSHCIAALGQEFSNWVNLFCYSHVFFHDCMTSIKYSWEVWYLFQQRVTGWIRGLIKILRSNVPWRWLSGWAWRRACPTLNHAPGWTWSQISCPPSPAWLGSPSWWWIPGCRQTLKWCQVFLEVLGVSSVTERCEDQTEAQIPKAAQFSYSSITAQHTSFANYFQLQCITVVRSKVLSNKNWPCIHLLTVVHSEIPKIDLLSVDIISGVLCTVLVHWGTFLD